MAVWQCTLTPKLWGGEKDATFGVADVLSLDHENHHFRNFAGMSGDPLKALGDNVDLDGAGNDFLVFQHEG